MNLIICFIIQRKERGGSPPSAEELESCVYNEEPGCPKLTIMSFNKGFHGRTSCR